MLRIEISKAPQNVTECVANLAVTVGHSFHQIVGRGDVLAKIDGSHPQANDLGAELLGHFHWVDSVAERLRHGASLRIQRPSIGGNATVGCSAFCAYSAQQGRVEPATILIAAL